MLNTSFASSRRWFFKLAGAAALAPSFRQSALTRTDAAEEPKPRGLPPLKITEVRVIVTCPDRNYVLVKILTSEAGLYGVGDATLNGRELAVAEDRCWLAATPRKSKTPGSTSTAALIGGAGLSR